MSKKQKKMLVRILISAALMIVLNFVPVQGYGRFILYLIPYLIIGYDILIKAFKGIKNRQPFDESLLMAIATIGAIAIALADSGDLSGGRVVPELCGGKEPPQYQRTDGYPAGLCQY